jgi:pilus assembly protein FimV
MGTSNLRLRSVAARHGRRLGAAVALLFPAWLQAYSVGEPQLLSRYAEPLKLQVPVTLAPSEDTGDGADLVVQLLPLSAYESLGLPVPALQPQAVQIRVQGEAPLYTVDIRSSQIVREPFLTLVLEVRLGGMRVLRELPLLFDLPQAQRPAEPAMAAPPVPQADRPETASVVPPAIADVAAADDSIKPVPESAAPPAQPAAVTGKPRRSPRLPSLRLDVQPPAQSVAPVGAGALPTPMPLPRFQLSSSFESYARLSAAGQRPEPVIAAVDPEPVEPLAVREEAVAPPAALPASPPAASDAGMLGWLLSFLAGVAATLFAVRWQERREQTPASLQGHPLPARSGIPASQAAAEAVPAPESALPVKAVIEAPMPVPAPAPVSATPSPDADAAAQDAIRRRIGELRLGNNDLNLARKLQLVEAYLDLGRAESAATLLAELEAGLPKATRPAFTLIKG